MASLTKEELKTALINHGIAPPPPSSRKDEFLALYEEHVKPVEDEAGEFSSDDEVEFYQFYPEVHYYAEPSPPRYPCG